MTGTTLKKLFSISYLFLLGPFWSGCETRQLTVDRDGPELAPVLGVDISDILFLSKCEFGNVRTNFRPRRAVTAFIPDRAISQYGILALTDSKIWFLSEERALLRSFAISELEGIAKTDYQIQLHYRGFLTVTELAPASSRKETRQKHETLFALLLERGVDKREAPKSYVLQLDARSRWSESGPVMRAFPRASPNRPEYTKSKSDE